MVGPRTAVIFVWMNMVCLSSGDSNSQKCIMPSCVNGKAEMLHGECQCLCDKGFMGPNCEIKDLCATDNPCHHGGRCYTRDNNQLYCDCPLGYLSPDCRDRDPCANKADHCLNGATCQRLDDIDFACACALPFEGDHCERQNLCRLDVGECMDYRTSLEEVMAECYPCSEHTVSGGCKMDHVGHYTCSCLPGYTGKTCDELTNATSFETTITLPLEKLYRMNPHNFIVHNIQLPSSHDVIILINVSSVYRIHVAINKDFRPTCSQVMAQWETFIPTLEAAPHRMLPRHPGIRSRRDLLSETNDYYIILWPEPSTVGSEGRVEVTMGLGFYHFDCVPFSDTQTLSTENSGVKCFTADEVSGRQLINCKCLDVGLESLREYLNPLEFRSELYLPIVLLEDVQPCYIIPWIVLAFLLLYLCLLLILCIVQKCMDLGITFVVMTDVDLIEEQYFYLLSVETGNQPFAGTTANVCCEIHGSLSRYSHLVLSDRTIDVLKRRGNETSYLFSTPKDLGELEMIRIWHDNSGSSPAWFVRKLTVKSLRTNRCWHFHIDRWLSVSSSSLILYAYAKTTGLPGTCVRASFSSILAFQLRNRHLFLSPVLCSPQSPYRPCVRLTVLFAVIFLHMVLLICCYGFPEQVDPIYMIKWDESWIFSSHVLLFAFAVALVGLLIASLLSCWYRCISDAKVPTLLICESKPPCPIRTALPENRDETLRWQNLEPGRQMVATDVKQETIATVNVPDNHLDFRIPSTSVSRTENWIASHVTRRRREAHEPVEKVPQYLRLDNYKKILNDGIMGAVTIMKDINMQNLIYKPVVDESVDELIGKDIRDSFGTDLWSREEVANLKVAPVLENPSTYVDTKEAIAQTEFEPVQMLPKPIEEDHHLKTDQVPRRNFSVKLCQVNTSSKYSSCRCSPIIVWLICLSIITCSAVLTVLYGMRYGITLTMDWIFSFFWTFIFSIVLSLLFQVFIHSIFSYCCAKRKCVADSLGRQCQRRFQLLRLQDCSDVQTYVLKYLKYLPKYSYIPLSACAMFRLKAEVDKCDRQRQNLMKFFNCLLYVLALVILLRSFGFSRLYYSKRSDENIFRSNGQFDLRMTTLRTHPDVLESVRDSPSLQVILRRIVRMSKREPLSEPAEQTRFHEFTRPLAEYLYWLSNNASLLLGSVRLRQQRLIPVQGKLQTENLTEPQTLEMNSKGLFKDTWLKSTKDTRSYEKGWSVELHKDSPRSNGNNKTGTWEWSSESTTKSRTYVGVFGNYDGGGYTIDIDVNHIKSFAAFQQLQNSGWLDSRTSVLFVELTTYNPFLKFFNVLQLIAERSPFRSWEIHAETRTYRCILGLDDLTGLQIILIFAALVFLAYFLLSALVAICRIYRDRKKHSRCCIDLSMCLDLTIVLCGFFTFAVFLAAIEASVEHFDRLSYFQQEFINFEILGHIYSLLFYSTVVLLLLGNLKLWILLPLSYLTIRWCNVFSVTTKQLLCFLLYFVLLLAAFATFSHLAFGSLSWQFKTFWQSMLTLVPFSKCGSSVSLRQIELYHRILGPAFFLAYYIFLYFLSVFLVFSIVRLGLQTAQGSWVYSRKVSAMVERYVPRKRLNKMAAVVQGTLLPILNSELYKRQVSMRALANQLVNPAVQRVVSHRTKLTAWRNAKSKNSTDRFERMEKLMLNFLRTKTGREFHQRDYNNCNNQIIRFKYEKLQKTLIKMEVLWDQSSFLK